MVSKKKSKVNSRSMRELGEVRIKMWVQPSIGKKPQWVDIPIKGTLFSQLKTEMDSLKVDYSKADISVALIKLWYKKLRKETALKIAFIVCMQRCVYYSYLKRPSWFGKIIKSTKDKKTIDDYFHKARVILCNYLTFRYDKNNGKGSAGYLRTKKSENEIIIKSRELVRHPKFHTIGVEKQQKKLQSIEATKGKFKTFDTLKSQCSRYDNRMMDIWDIVTGLKDIDEGIFGKMPCRQYFQEFKTQVQYIVSSHLGYVDFLLYGGYISDQQATFEVSQSTNTAQNGDNNGRKSVFEVDVTRMSMKQNQSSTPLKRDSQTPAFKRSLQNKQNLHVVDSTVQDDDTGIDTGSIVSTSSTARKASGGLTKPVKPKRPAGMTMVEYKPIYEKYMEDAIAWKKAHSKFGRRHARRYSMAHRRRPMRRMSGRRMGSRFGRSPNLTRMVGYTPPHRISAMEQYTGMTPRMYKRHINSRTGTPMGIRSSPRLSESNSYYGSYALGEKLNPGFGRKRKRCASKGKKRCASKGKKRCASKTKKKTVGRKRKRSASFGLKRKRCASKTKKRCATKGRKKTVGRKRKRSSSFGSFFF